MNCYIRGYDADGEWLRVSLEIEDETEALPAAERMGIRSPDIRFYGCERPPFHPDGGACGLRCSISGVDATGKRRSAMVQVDTEAEALAAADRMGIEQPRFQWLGHWPASTAPAVPPTSPTPDMEASQGIWGHLWEGLWVGFVVGFIANFRPFRRD